MFKNKSRIETCRKCGKEYEVVLTTYPAKMEEGRFYETYYTCPWCGHSTDVTIGPDQDIKAIKIEK